MHDFPRVSGIRFADRNQHQVVKNAFRRHAHVANLGQLHAHQGEKDALDRLSHVVVLHGRRADDRRRVDRLLTLGNTCNMKDRVLIGE